MHTIKKTATSLAILVFLTLTVSAQPRHTFSYKGEDFLLDGKPFIIRSGEMHYPRVPRIYWRDRFKKAKAMGLNTITTYIFWNLHEPKPGKFDFTGNLDIVEYIKTAQQEGLYVIVRPGPYICTEWDFGGLPAWLLDRRTQGDMKVRSSDPGFLSAARAYILEVGKRLAPLQISRGGNIITTQVENEYGSFGDDKTYLDAVRRMIVDAGFDVPLFTSDGSEDYQLKNGTLADTLSVINFGVDEKNGVKAVEKEFENFARFRQHVPRMVGEYWIGWFDHWGGKRHTVSPEAGADGVNWLLDHGISFNLYMFHGGTNFGFMNGANATRESQFMPDTTSYDYDATLDEAGNPTRKYFLIRDVIQKHLPGSEKLPEVPKSSALIAIPEFHLKETADFFSLLKDPVQSEQPLSMEDVGQSYGFILYRTKLNTDANGPLKFENIRDYAHVFVDGRLVGQLDRRLNQNELPINARNGSTVDVLVENGGRVNFGKNFVFERKGIVGSAKAANEELRNWEMFKLPLENLSSLKFANGITKKDGPVFYRGSFSLRDVGDTYLDMSSWGKGHVWINGHHLGRYWNIGPQQSLFLPANWLRKGTNEVIILDVLGPKFTSVRGVSVPIFRN